MYFFPDIALSGYNAFPLLTLLSLVPLDKNSGYNALPGTARRRTGRAKPNYSPLYAMSIDGEDSRNGVAKSLDRVENALLSVRPAARHSKIGEYFSLICFAFFLKKSS